jgi:acyl carrier protein
MELNEFVQSFSEEFEDTSKELFLPETEYKSLDEWDSLTTLSIISMVDEKMGKRITGADLRACKTIEELFNSIQIK